MPILSLFGSPVQGIIDEQGIVDDTTIAFATGLRHMDRVSSPIALCITIADSGCRDDPPGCIG
ncbi:MAG: hypothetical protein AAGJ40_04510 [Planctomycetota bacterium]